MSPEGPGATNLLSIMEKAHAILAKSETNRRLIKKGKLPATDIWLWGKGRAIELPSMADRYGLSGSVISAVDLVRGLGVCAGL